MSVSCLDNKNTGEKGLMLFLEFVSYFHPTPATMTTKLQIADRILIDCGNERDVKRTKPKTLTITKQLPLSTHINFMDAA